MELAEQLVKLAELLTELKAQGKIQQLKELKVQIKIQQLKELKVFNTLKLSIEALIEVLLEVLMDVTTDIATEAVASRLGYYSRGLDTN